MTPRLIGCGTDEQGLTECDICNAYKNDPLGCQEWRSLTDAITKEVV